MNVHITRTYTPSRPFGEVKPCRAKSVVRYVSTCEALVTFAFLHFALLFHFVATLFFLEMACLLALLFAARTWLERATFCFAHRSRASFRSWVAGLWVLLLYVAAFRPTRTRAASPATHKAVQAKQQARKAEGAKVSKTRAWPNDDVTAVQLPDAH